MNNGSSAPDNANGPKPLELTDYDLQRRPHKAITDSTEIRIFPRMLAAELCCPICLDLLTTTMTSKECLHRFCCECITTALMRGNKECPTCRKKLISKRSLRPDPNFDALINKIWPDRQVYERLQEKALEIFQQQSNIKALQKSIEAGMKEQARNRRQRVQGSYDYERRKRRGRPPEHPDRSENNSPESISPEFSGEGEMEVDQVNERNEDGSVAPGTSGADGAVANGVSHSTTNSLSDSDGSLDSSSDSSLTDSSDDSSDTSSTSTSGSAVQAGSSKPQVQQAISGELDSPQLPPPSLPDANHPVEPPSTTCTLKDRINKWVEKSLSEAITPDETLEQLERRVDEDLDLADIRNGGGFLDIEAELLPAKSLLKRNDIPAPMLRRRYIRTKGDTTMEHLGEFLHQVCCEEMSAETITGPSHAQHFESAIAQVSASVPRPEHFYVYSRFGGHSVNKIFGNENVLSALHAQKRGDHLMIFFDTAPLDVRSKSVLDEIVYGDFLK